MHDNATGTYTEPPLEDTVRPTERPTPAYTG